MGGASLSQQWARRVSPGAGLIVMNIGIVRLNMASMGASSLSCGCSRSRGCAALSREEELRAARAGLGMPGSSVARVDAQLSSCGLRV